MVREIGALTAFSLAEHQTLSLWLATGPQHSDNLIKVELWTGKILDNKTRDDGGDDRGDTGESVTREDFINKALQLDIIRACLRSSRRDLGFSS